MKLLRLLLAVVTALLSVASAAANPNFLHENAPAPEQRRGVVFNQPKYPVLFFNPELSRVYWTYNWQAADSQSDAKWEFIPMLRSNSAENTGSWLDSVNRSANFVVTNPTHLLGFHEPDICQNGGGGTCISVDAAVTAWKQFMDPAKTFKERMFLGSPAVSNSDAPGEGLDWLESFMDKCNDCKVDFICVHWYGQAKDIDNFKQHIDETRKVAAGRPIWVTEFYADGIEGEVMEFLSDVLPWMDHSTDIHRYAYFMAAPGILLNAEGTALSRIGDHYNFMMTTGPPANEISTTSGPVRPSTRDLKLPLSKDAQSDASLLVEPQQPAVNMAITQVPECEKGKCALCNNRFCTCQLSEGKELRRSLRNYSAPAPAPAPVIEHQHADMPGPYSKQSDTTTQSEPPQLTSNTTTTRPLSCQRNWCWTCNHGFCTCQPCPSKAHRRRSRRNLPASVKKGWIVGGAAPSPLPYVPMDPNKPMNCRCCCPDPDGKKICFKCVCPDKGISKSRKMILGSGGWSVERLAGGDNMLSADVGAAPSTSSPPDAERTPASTPTPAPLTKRISPSLPDTPLALNGVLKRGRCVCCLGTRQQSCRECDCGGSGGGGGKHKKV